MIDYNRVLVSVLKTILPTHHELTLTSNTQTPCISYQERNNYSTAVGDTLGYSNLTYTIKVWGNRIEDLETYSLQIDEALRPLGFKRTSTNELYDINSTMIQKIMTFEATGFETY